MTIKIPDKTTIHSRLTALHGKTSFTDSFSARLGRLDGSTVIEPDRPYTDANLYVWYNVDGREHLALVGSMSGVPYNNDLYGLEVMIGKPPANLGYADSERAVIGLNGAAGRIGAGGNNIYDQYITNNTYIITEQVRVLRVEPYSGLIVSVTGPYPYPDSMDNTLTLWETDFLDLTATQATVGAGEHCLAMIALDTETHVMIIVASTPVTPAGSLPARDEFTFADVAALYPALGTAQPCGIVYLYDGQAAIVEADLLRDFEVKSLYTPPYNQLRVNDPTTAGDIESPTGPFTVDERGVVIASPSGTYVLNQDTNYVATATDVYVGVDLTPGLVYVTLPPLSTVNLGHQITVHDLLRLATPTIGVAVIPTAGDTIDEWYCASGCPATTINMFGAGQSDTFQVVENSTAGKMWHIMGTSRAPLFVTQSQAINMGSHQITNLTDGTSPQDAVSLAQLTAAVAGSSGSGSTLYTYYYLG